MTELDFFVRVQETLELDGPIDRSTNLEDIEEYDSLGILNLMSLFDELGVEVDQDSFTDINSGEDLLRLASGKISA